MRPYVVLLIFLSAFAGMALAQYTQQEIQNIVNNDEATKARAKTSIAYEWGLYNAANAEENNLANDPQATAITANGQTPDVCSEHG